MSEQRQVIPDWWIYGAGDGAKERLASRPPAPSWRRFDAESREARGRCFVKRSREMEMINAALLLRRPLLITGKPGTGKTSLTYAVAEELGLDVLRWSIDTTTTLRDGLYRYDAIARLQDASLQHAPAARPDRQRPSLKGTRRQTPAVPRIGRYLRLGPLGTAFALSTDERPLVLLVDEIDKSDLDLPNNLLHLFEEGEFTIPELTRLPEASVRIPADGGHPDVDISRGKVRCRAFPLVIMTSNGEREFPPAFRRRCLTLDLGLPTEAELKDMVRLHLFNSDKPDAPQLEGELEQAIEAMIADFVARRDARELAADQLLNAVYLVLSGADPERSQDLKEALWRSLAD